MDVLRPSLLPGLIYRSGTMSRARIMMVFAETGRVFVSYYRKRGKADCRCINRPATPAVLER